MEPLPGIEETLLGDWLRNFDSRERAVTPSHPDTFLRFCRKWSSPPWIAGRHLTLIARRAQVAVERAMRGEGDAVIFSAPPRHGKSHTTTVLLPAWAIGAYANLGIQIMLTSYGGSLALKKSRLARSVFLRAAEAEWGLRVSRESAAASAWAVAGTNAQLLAAGVGGPITGEGAHLAIIDDPHKNWQEANSRTYLASIWDWYTSTFASRVEPGGSVLLIATRWHEADLIGQLLDSEGTKAEGGRWDMIRLPALIETGEDADADPLHREAPNDALWQARWPRDELVARRNRTPSRVWAANWQQRPQPSSGKLIQRQHFRYARTETRLIDGEQRPYYVLQVSETEEITVPVDSCWNLITCDTALSEAQDVDYTAALVWAITPKVAGLSRRILLEVVRQRLAPTKQVPLLEQMARRHRVRWVGIEKAQAGAAIITYARERGLSVTACVPDKDKVTRALPLIAAYEAGQVFHPFDDAPWLGDYEAELLAMPGAAHDDQWDAAAYMEILVRKLDGPVVWGPASKVESRPETVFSKRYGLRR